MSLTNKTIANTYKDILQVNNSNNGITTLNKQVESGDGTKSSLQLSDDSLAVIPQDDNSTSTFLVKDNSGTVKLRVDTTNSAVKALGQYVNTGVQQFHYTSVNSKPSSANTWSGLDAQGGGGRFRSTVIEMGTGGTPATTYDVSGGNIADDLVMSIWYVPFNLSIDAVHCWFGQDAASGDVVKFSVMSYTVSTANDATGGDLSAGVENCVSPSAITGAGYEQAYYQALTISTANVDAGKVIMACVSQDGTNADLTVNLQLVYHLRST